MGDSSSEFAALKLEDSPAPIPHSVGVPGTGCQGGHANELGHSIAPMIEEKHARLSFTMPVDPNVSDQITDSIPDSADTMPDIKYDVPSDSDPDDYIPDSEDMSDIEYEVPSDPDSDSDVCMEKLRAIIDGSVKTNNLKDVVDKVTSLRRSYNMLNCRIGHDVVSWMTESALKSHHDSEEEFNKYIEKMFIDWKDPLKSFITETSDELVVIGYLQFICSEIPTTFYPFPKILTCLYEKGIVSKLAVLCWAQNEWGNELNEIFVSQAHKLVKELKEEAHNIVNPYAYFYPEVADQVSEEETKDQVSEEETKGWE